MNDNIQHEPEQGDQEPDQGDDMVDPEPGRHRHRPQVDRQMVGGNVVCSVVQDGARLSWIQGIETCCQVNRSPNVDLPVRRENLAL
jgi:hypothetical protein